MLIYSRLVGHFRDYQNIGVQVFYGVAQIALVAEGYYYPSWKTISFYWLFLPILALNVPILLLQESPMFMYGKDQRKTVKILNRIAKFNGRNELQIIDLQKNPSKTKKNEKTYSVLDLIRYKSIRTMFLLGNVMFFSIQAVYYGINFALSTIGLNIYINALIIAGCETLAIILSDYLIAFCSRKKVIVACFFVASLLQISFILLNPDKDAGPTDVKVLLQIIFAGVSTSHPISLQRSPASSSPWPGHSSTSSSQSSTPWSSAPRHWASSLRPAPSEASSVPSLSTSPRRSASTHSSAWASSDSLVLPPCCPKMTPSRSRCYKKSQNWPGRVSASRATTK